MEICLLKGNSSKVETKLKNKCRLAICMAGFPGVQDPTQAVNGSTQSTARKNAVPSRLMSRCRRAQLRAAGLRRALAHRAVAQVPIF